MTVGDEITGDIVRGGALEMFKRLAATYWRTAEVLNNTAVLAEEHAQRREHAGQPISARHEYRVAEQARSAARRALELGDVAQRRAQQTATEQPGI